MIATKKDDNLRAINKYLFKAMDNLSSCILMVPTTPEKYVPTNSYVSAVPSALSAAARRAREFPLWSKQMTPCKKIFPLWIKIDHLSSVKMNPIIYKTPLFCVLPRVFGRAQLELDRSIDVDFSGFRFRFIFIFSKSMSAFPIIAILVSISIFWRTCSCSKQILPSEGAALCYSQLVNIACFKAFIWYRKIKCDQCGLNPPKRSLE